MIRIIFFHYRDFAYRKCTQTGLRHQIKKLFQDTEKGFLEGVKMRPEETLRIGLRLIKEHLERHIRTKHEQERIWKELCEKNFPKSLDHRSFYFKQM